MSAALPASVDVWRMVQSRRRFEGRLQLIELPRLAELLSEQQGECEFSLQFGRDDFNRAFVDVNLDARLPLLCQRSLETFFAPVKLEQRLGLLQSESQESALDEGMEAWLVDPSGHINPADFIEDELILAIPAIPVKPGTEAMEADWPAEESEPEEQPNPFAALAALKQSKRSGE